MLKKKFLQSIFLTATFVSTAVAQEANNLYFKHLTRQEGLAHNNVLDIKQDNKGFIWVLTSNGLQRYDGNRFQNTQEILHNPIFEKFDFGSLDIETDKNYLWINKLQSLEKLDLVNNRLYTFNAAQLIAQPDAEFKKYTDSWGSEWQVSKNYVLLFDKVSRYYLVSTMNSNYNSPYSSSSMLIDNKSGDIWLANNSKGILLFSSNDKKVYSNSNNPKLNPILKAFANLFSEGAGAARKLMRDSHNNYWVTTWGPVFYNYNITNKKITRYSLNEIIRNENANFQNKSPKSVTGIFEDNHGTVWVSTENAGLLKYNFIKNIFEPVSITGNNSRNKQFNFTISCIFEDKEENIWMGTDKGITLFNPYRQFFKTLHFDKTSTGALSNSEINCYTQTTTGAILVGTWGAGIAIFDSLLQFKKNISFKENPDYNLVWSLVENDDGNIWAGCQHGYIHIYNSDNGSIKTIHPSELNNFTILCMAKDGEGDIWMGLYNGQIAKWEKNTNKFYTYPSDSIAPGSLSAINNIFIDKKNSIWVSTVSGLKGFNKKDKKFTELYPFTFLTSPQKSAEGTYGMTELNDSILLVGTVNYGFQFFNSALKKFIIPEGSTNFANNTVFSIRKDNSGQVWFSTDYNIFKLMPGEKKFTKYNIDPGIIYSAFKSGGFYPLKNGNWLTSTATDLVYFNPNISFQIKPTFNKVEITGFKIYDKTLLVDSLLNIGKPIELYYTQNFLTIDFSLLNFLEIQQSKYYFLLSNVDKDWVDAGDNHFASYTNLSPGKYVFSVKANNGDFNTGITSFSIIIKPPFWKSDWFLLLIAFSVMLLGYLLLKWRIRIVRSVEKEKLNNLKSKFEIQKINEQLSNAKMEALQSQMNPHFIFNCINSIDSLIQSDDKYHATVYLNKFAKLLRNILHSSKQNTITLSKDLDTLQLYIEMEQLRNEHSFVSEIEVSNELLQQDDKVPPLILQPFVENAIIHGLRYRQDNNGKLTIKVSKETDYIKYVIEDNGVGRNFEKGFQKERISYGIEMSKERIKLFNQEKEPSLIITDLEKDGKPSGTRVALKLKI